MVNPALSAKAPNVAVIVTGVDVATPAVLTVNVPVVEPAGTVTEAGGIAAEPLEVRGTTRPPLGAGDVRVSVPVEVAPPTTVVGERVNPASDGGLTVSRAVAVNVPCVTVIVAAFVDATGTVPTVNVAVVAPAGTVTDAGTVAQELLEESPTVVPPVGAGRLKVTVPIEDVPPTTAAGETVSCNWPTFVMESVAVADFEPDVAVITAEVTVETTCVAIVNDAVVAPPATVTNAGTPAAVLLLDWYTMSPPAGAALESVTLPVDVKPPTTVFGLRVRPVAAIVLTWVPMA